MKCPACSKPVTATDRFCIYCGCDLKKTPVNRPAAAEPVITPRPRARVKTAAEYNSTSVNTTAKKRKKKKTPVLPIVLAVVLVVLIAVGIIALLTRTKQPKPSDALPIGTTTAGDTTVSIPATTVTDPDGSGEALGEYVLASESVAVSMDGSFATENFLDVYTVLKKAIAEGRGEVKISSAGIAETEVDIILSHFMGDLIDANCAEEDAVYRLEIENTRSGLKVLSAKKNGAEGTLSGTDAQLLSKAQEIVSANVKDGMSEKQKARALYDALIACCEPTGAVDDGADAALLNGSAGYIGYADAYRLLCGLAGLDARCVSSTVVATGEIVVWNVVKINGTWYAVNAANGDAESADGSFMLKLDALRSDESWNEYTLPDGNYAM